MRWVVCLSWLTVTVVGQSRVTPSVAQDTTPPEVQRVLRYIAEEEPLEVFKGDRRPFRLTGFAVLDIDGDGATEVFLSAKPYYRQSPTVLIYSLEENGTERRVAEGLAPGPFVPVSGHLIDNHTLGLGVDLTIGEPEKALDLVRYALRQPAHMVRYADFFHMDMRDSGNGYIDLSGRTSPVGDVTCGGFEFSTVNDIAAGYAQNRTVPYLVVAAADSLYVYRISGVTEEGFLKKQVWARRQPSDFARLSTRSDNTLMYESRSGELRKFEFSLER